MDRHALQSKARDDRETKNAPNPNTPQDSRICDDFGGFLKKHRLAPSGVLVFKARAQGFI